MCVLFPVVLCHFAFFKQGLVSLASNLTWVYGGLDGNFPQRLGNFTLWFPADATVPGGSVALLEATWGRL